MATNSTSKTTSRTEKNSTAGKKGTEQAMVEQVRRSAAKVSEKALHKAKGAVQALPDRVSTMSRSQKAVALGAIGAAGVAAAAGVAKVRSRRRASTPSKIFVVESYEGGWRLKQQGAKRARSTFEVKADAVAAGREAANREAPSELVILSQEGEELDRHRYEA